MNISSRRSIVLGVLFSVAWPVLAAAQGTPRYQGPPPDLRPPQLTAPKGWAVVLVDMQPRGVYEGTTKCGMSEHRARRVIKPQALFLKGVRQLGIPVVVVESKGDGQTHSQLLDQVDPSRSYTVVKTRRDAFDPNGIWTAAGVAETLRQWKADKVVVFGVNRSMCVMASAQGGVQNGYQIVVPDRLNDDFFLHRDAIERLPQTGSARAFFAEQNAMTLRTAALRDPMFRRSSADLLRLIARNLGERGAASR